MTEQVIITIVSTVGGILTAVVSVVISQLTKINRRMRKLEHRDRLSWLYIRSLIDHAYRHQAIPLPEPPPGWFDDPSKE